MVKASLLKKDLFSFKSQALSKKLIGLILLLDIIILGFVFDGIDSQVDYIAKPSEVFPYKCVNTFNRYDNNFKESYETVKYYNKNKYTADASDDFIKETKDLSPYCQQLNQKVAEFRQDDQYIIDSKKYAELTKEKYDNKRQISRSKQRYDTSLLETIANKENNSDELKLNYDNLLVEEQYIERSLRAFKNVNDYTAFRSLIAYINKNKEIVNKEYNSAKRYYRFKVYAITLLFSLPLIALSFFLYFRNKTKQLKSLEYNNIVLMIAAHLTIVFSIPIIFGVLDLFWSIIPKEFLAKVFIVLENLEIMMLGFYGLIFLTILGFGLVIYAVQKFEKGKHRKYTVVCKSIKKSVCYECKNKVNYDKDRFCSFCQTQLLDKCPSCSEDKIKQAQYCRSCGEEDQSTK